MKSLNSLITLIVIEISDMNVILHTAMHAVELKTVGYTGMNE